MTSSRRSNLVQSTLGSLILREAHGGALGVRDVTEHLAIQAIIRLGGGEETIAAGVTYHDARGPRRNFDDVGVRHFRSKVLARTDNNGDA